MPRPTTCIALSAVIAFAPFACGTNPLADRKLVGTFPLEPLPDELPSRETRAYEVDEATALDAIRGVLESMQYKAESIEPGLGVVIARGGLVRYNPALVAAGMVVINGALIVAAVLGSATVIPGIELDTQLEYRLVAFVWRRPGDEATLVRVAFMPMMKGVYGDTSERLAWNREPYDAFFTLLDQRLRKAGAQ